MNETLLTIGIACIIAAIIGGGLKAFNIEIPLLQSTIRQVGLGLFGIILLVSAFVVPVLLQSASQGGCFVSGRVFDPETNKPLAGIHLALYSGLEPRRDKQVALTAAITDIDGTFRFDCPADIERDQFPLRIYLWNPNWQGRWVTPEIIAYAQKRTNVIITQNMSKVTLNEPPYQARPAISPGPVGQVITIRTEGFPRSYDFLNNIIGKNMTGGDFYFDNSYPQFWANNLGQRGVLDLGDIPDRLDAVTPPTSGYTHYRVRAIVGHTYVALARVPDDKIVFRVLDIGYSDGDVQFYTIQSYYRSHS